MLAACQNHVAGHDIFIAVAAVADWKVAQVATQKIKKAHADDVPSLDFVQTPDILATIANLPNAPFCVGFAAESENVLEYAQAKRIKKNVPLMIANQGPKTFGSEYNQVSLVSEAGVAQLPNMRKDQLAQQLIQAIAKQFASQQK